jgi:hypothetical protein
MTTEEDHAGLGPASNIGGGQLIGRSWARSIDLPEASRRGKSGMWRPSDTDNGFLSPERLPAATRLALGRFKRFANVPRKLKYRRYCFKIEILRLVCKDGNTRIAGISLPAATGAGPIAAPVFARRSTCRL